MFDIAKLVQDNRSRGLDLQATYINPAFAKVLKTIGFDRTWTRGQGAYLWDDKEDRYLDLLSGYGVFGVGRNHPTVRDALKTAMDADLPSLIKMDAPVLSGLLARELLKKAAHTECERVFFANSGAEAVEAAMKFSRAYTGRNEFLYLNQSYHGLTLGALSVNGCASFRNGFGELYDARALRMGDLAALEEALATKRYAGFIFEPVQGKGVYFPNDDYYQQAANLCKRHGTLFIADEVQSGMGRTGKFFAHEHWNLKPDLITISKSLSGGYVPISAVLLSKHVHQKTFSSMDRSVVHSSTFSQNDFAAAAGLATLHVLEAENLIQNAERMGQLFLDLCRPMVDRFEMLKEVRGKGLMVGFEFGAPKSLSLNIGWKLVHTADKSLFAQLIVLPLFTKHKILTQVAGHGIDIIKLLPTLTVGEDDVRWFARAFEDVMIELHKFPGSIWDVGLQLAKGAIGGKPKPEVTI
ncbi:MAG TPA: aspartate aminotransferase family protein [Oligoflexia bacterium]|nr:aspartate aminotransferase family protein [Oligoflexia bacterium]